PLRLNFRSQKPLVDFFNFLFAKVFRARGEVPSDALGELGYVEHEPGVALREAELDLPHVDLIVSVLRDESESGEETESVLRTGDLTAHERDAEQVAARIRSLVDSGNNYKDVAILLRAFT